ncbi:MAG: hypothetical protein U0840_12465 [Gemmataceae bacterium]
MSDDPDTPEHSNRQPGCEDELRKVLLRLLQLVAAEVVRLLAPQATAGGESTPPNSPG